ncbi:cell envelope integrity protein TolA [Amycolatopsis samaneae]|uniref:Cell envelope integrity protein TolA n=1 Tax=Amycolatopsis samaneae TaxID=664691 RepID=A0ABW5GPG2_9PSEU
MNMASEDEPVAEWLAEITKAAGQSVDVVRTVLAEHGVRAQTSLPRPRRLLITDIEFSGTRTAGVHEAAAVPFDFHWRLGAGLWGLASSGVNEAGKSSVLEIILWCLRGRSGLQRDVQSWLRSVRLGFELDDDRLVVRMKVQDGRPQGTLSSLNADGPLFGFNSATSFEAKMDAFMLDRLGLETLLTQQKRPGGVEGPPLVGELSWPAYASALHINRAGLGQLLGNENRNALPTRLLELFIGAPWASTMVSAAVAQRIVAARLSAARAIASRNEEEQKQKVEAIQQEIRETQGKLAQLVEGAHPGAGQVEAYRRLTKATEYAADAQKALLVAKARRDDLEDQRQRLLAAAQATKEAKLAKAFFHTLRPTVCPRCDAEVTHEQWAQEEGGHCSLCTSELREPEVRDQDTTEDSDVDDTAEMDQTLSEIQAAVDAADTECEQKRQLTDTARSSVEQAEAALRRAQDDPRVAMREKLSLDLARMRGVLEERTGAFKAIGDPSGIAPLERDLAVLSAAENASRRRRTEALKNVIATVEDDILGMGRKLGLDMLENVELGTNATMKVYKGGQHQNYGSLTEGEQLRLKIVTTTALLRNGIRTGIGRHPGLLIIDSPGAEEVGSGDLQLMVQGLAELTKAAPELQIIIATARGQEVASVIDESRLRLAPPGERLW